MSISFLPKGEGRSAATTLILATERLVALHGVYGVSLRQIIEAAQVRNASAVHYHFGSREGLFAAVYQYRIAAVDERRLAGLRQLKREHRLGDCRAIVAAMVYGLAGELEPRSEGNFYVRFVERCSREFGHEPPPPIAKTHRIALIKAGAYLTRLLAYLPAEIVEIRLLASRVLGLYGLAAIEADLERNPSTRAMLPLRIEMLIDSLVAALQGPVSAETLSHLPAKA